MVSGGSFQWEGEAWQQMAGARSCVITSSTTSRKQGGEVLSAASGEVLPPSRLHLSKFHKFPKQWCQPGPRSQTHAPVENISLLNHHSRLHYKEHRFIYHTRLDVQIPRSDGSHQFGLCQGPKLIRCNCASICRKEGV